jgi:hypothetical protein
VNEPIDDRQIEDYLRSFHPLPAAPLPEPKSRWRFATLSALAAAAMIVLLLIPQFRREAPALAEQQPITIGSANQLLARSSSWNMIDDAGFAFRSSQARVSPRHRSVLEFLGREDLSK